MWDNVTIEPTAHFLERVYFLMRASEVGLSIVSETLQSVKKGRGFMGAQHDRINQDCNLLFIYV